MLQSGGSHGVLGFEVFAEEFDARYASWFESFLADLHLPEAKGSTRLKLLERYLKSLVELLDTEGLYARRSRQAAADESHA